MKIVIVNNERPRSGASVQPIVSHGVDLDTGRTFALPSVHPAGVGATFDPEIGEYVFSDEPSGPRP